MSKRSGGAATAESAAGAIHDNRMFAERAFYCIANGAGERPCCRAARRARPPQARFMTIECSRSVHSIVLRMARGNVREKATVELIINISTNYVGVDKWEAYN